MLLAHLPHRSPFDHHHPPADRSLQAPHLPFTLVCRDADRNDSCIAFRRYAYLDDCIHDLRLAIEELYADADQHYYHSPETVDDLAYVLDIYAHGEHRLSITSTGFDTEAMGHWSQIWPFLAQPFALYLPDTDPSEFENIFPF